MMFKFSIEDAEFEWNGGHTVNMYVDERNVSCFSLDYTRESFTEAEVMASALDWLAYEGRIPVTITEGA